MWKFIISSFVPFFFLFPTHLLSKALGMKEENVCYGRCYATRVFICIIALKYLKCLFKIKKLWLR